MTRRLLGRSIAVAFGLGTALLLALVSVQHVPHGKVVLEGTRVVSHRLALHAPLAPRPLLDDPGSVAVESVPWTTREGSRLEFSLELSYTLADAIALQLADDARSKGWVDAVGALAGHVLEEVGRRTDTETLLSSRETTEAPLRAALESAGVHVVQLRFTSHLGDELVRRTRTDEARRLMRPAVARIVVVGWDGADWNIARPLMAAGRMPNLARLVRDGASADLRSYDPMFSPLIWTTVATGKPPTEHGIADFLVRDAGGKQRRPITSDFRRVKALWNIFTDFQRSSTWIGWWASFPAEPARGLIVSDYLGAALGSKSPDEAVALAGLVSPAGGLPHPAAVLVTPSQIGLDDVTRIIPATPEDYRAAQAEIAASRDAKGKDSGQPASPVAFVMHVLAVTRSYHGIELEQLRAGSPFVAVYFEGIDMMGHGFQHYLPPKMTIVSQPDFERFQNAVTRFYEYQDALLGETLDAAGREAVVVVLSDHGFRTGDDRPNFPPSTKGQPEEWHRDWGMLALAGPGIRAGKIPPASVYDVTPTLLYLSGLPLASDMPGRLLTNAFEPSVLARRPAEHLRSYELVGPRLEHATASVADPAAMHEMLANLKALGYVGGADDEPQAATSTTPAPTAPVASETQYFYHRNLAVLYIDQGRLAEAESELLAANERSQRGKTYEMLSQVRAKQGRYAEAIAGLEEGWRRVPDQMDPSSLLWIVDLNLLHGDLDAAKRSLETWSARMTPGVRVAAQGRVLEASGDADGARRAYRQSLESDPLTVTIAQRLSRLDAAAGQPFDLEPFLLKTVAAHPKVDAYWDMAGQISMGRADYADAVERFGKANALQPDEGLYIGHLASALAASGRPDDARRALAWTDRVAPSDAEAWMAVGAAWDRLGDADLAVRAFREARKRGLPGPGADIGEALALARAGRSAEAVRVLNAADARFPGSPALASIRERLRR
ncbi:MAG TPA: alkaline phosphatase family protein [Candidatus Polarisedimenticolaceae bacterium]|nr:alkaline phosphatase family protein [Candidatus Polarisedimenticolaceae bacterium]